MGNRMFLFCILIGAAACGESKGGSGGSGGPGGAGICSTGSQTECNDCVAQAIAVCNQSVCQSEYASMESCIVTATQVGCFDDGGNPVGVDQCCVNQRSALSACADTCPEYQACT